MRYVHAFEEGSKEQKYLLGGKGANLAEMTNLGLPVPPGFTISTDACKAYTAADDTMPDGLMDEVAAARTALESDMGKRLGDGTDPLLVAVRYRAERRRPQGPGDDVQGDRREGRRCPVPGRPDRAARLCDRRGVQVVERPPGARLPPHGAHPRRPRDRGERADDGVRQQG